MATVELETLLSADAAIVLEHIQQPRLMCFVAKGLLTFRPVDPDAFPERWSVGQYRVRKYLWGVFPIGWQIIAIEILPDKGKVRRLRDNGRGWLLPIWHHTIEIEQIENGTRYTDRVRIEAGLLTPMVTFVARFLYKHRQRRLLKLVAADFDYGVS